MSISFPGLWPATPENLALFYQPDLSQNYLSEDESKHIHVLRIRPGQVIQLTDGMGVLCNAELVSVKTHKAEYRIHDKNLVPRRSSRIHLAVAPTKSIDRIEWMVEKCTEIGIDRISFIECHNSERRKIPVDRIRKLTVSAMKQSGQTWLPELSDLIPFGEFIVDIKEDQRFIAHVDEDNPNHLVKLVKTKGDCVLLIGPEGDFTREEIEQALNHKFKKVSLGLNRLRTETAGVVGVTVLNAISNS